MNPAILIDPRPPTTPLITLVIPEPSPYLRSSAKSYTRYLMLLAALAAGGWGTWMTLKVQSRHVGDKVQQSLYASYGWDKLHRTAPRR